MMGYADYAVEDEEFNRSQILVSDASAIGATDNLSLGPITSRFIDDFVIAGAINFKRFSYCGGFILKYLKNNSWSQTFISLTSK